MASGGLKFDLRTGRGHGDHRPPGPRVLELEMRVPNLVALQERIDNVELSIRKVGGDRGAGRRAAQALIT